MNMIDAFCKDKRNFGFAAYVGVDQDDNSELLCMLISP